MQELTKKDAQRALLIAEELKDDYRPFFRNLLNYYEKNDPKSEAAIRLRSALNKTRRAIGRIPRVFTGDGLQAISYEGLDHLNNLLYEIDVDKDWVLHVANLPKEVMMHEAMGDMTTLTGIDPQMMKLTGRISRAAEKQYKKMHKPRRGGGGGVGIGSLIREAGGAFGITPSRAAIFGVVSQVLGPLLGPFFTAIPILGMGGVAAFKSLRGVYRGARGLGRWASRKLTPRGKVRSTYNSLEAPPIENRGPGSPDVPQAKEKPIEDQGVLPSMPELQEFEEPKRSRRIPMAQPSTRGDKPSNFASSPPVFNFSGAGAKITFNMAKPTIRARDKKTGQYISIPVGAPAAGPDHIKRSPKMNRAELHNAALPIWYFFNRLADKAKWTKAMLAAAKKSNSLLKKGNKLSKGSKLSIGKIALGTMFGAVLGKAAHFMATKLLFSAGVIAFAAVVFTKLYKRVKEFAGTLANVSRTMERLNTINRTSYDRIQAITEKRIEASDMPETRKTEMKTQLRQHLFERQRRDEYTRIRHIPEKKLRKAAMEEWKNKYGRNSILFGMGSIKKQSALDQDTAAFLEDVSELRLPDGSSVMDILGAPEQAPKPGQEDFVGPINPYAAKPELIISQIGLTLDDDMLRLPAGVDKAREEITREIKLLGEKLKGIAGGEQKTDSCYSSSDNQTDNVNLKGGDSLRNR